MQQFLATGLVPEEWSEEAQQQQEQCAKYDRRVARALDSLAAQEYRSCLRRAHVKLKMEKGRTLLLTRMGEAFPKVFNPDAELRSWERVGYATTRTEADLFTAPEQCKQWPQLTREVARNVLSKAGEAVAHIRLHGRLDFEWFEKHNIPRCSYGAKPRSDMALGHQRACIIDHEVRVEDEIKAVAVELKAATDKQSADAQKLIDDAAGLLASKVEAAERVSEYCKAEYGGDLAKVPHGSKHVAKLRQVLLHHWGMAE